MFRALARQSSVEKKGIPVIFCACRFQCSLFSSNSGSRATHYEILGVQNTASVTDIKKAFRQKAKRAHPDAVGQDTKRSSHAFGDILTAYQVLTNARERQLYDLSINPRTSRAARNAASDDSQDGASDRRDGSVDANDGLGWMREDSWAAWAATAPAPAAPTNKVDRMRSQLRTELRSALRHAYLGPQLEVGEGQLPDCFEADERSDPEAQDVLQLVSGRTVLGVVTQRKEQFVTGGGQELENTRLRPDSPLIEGTHSSRDGSQGAEPRGPSTAEGGMPVHRTRLQLSIGSQISAFGLQERTEGGAVTTSIFDSQGGIVAVERDGRLLKGSRNIDRTGERSQYGHEVIRWRTPFVNHLQFLGHQGGKRQVVCKARRARLPPSSLWIFPPRSEQHSERSWYFEWPGHGASDHPLWLPPSVFVLTAAFDSLVDERLAEDARNRGLIRTAARWTRSKIGL